MKMQIQLFSKISPLNAAALFWVGTLLSGNIFVAVANSMNFESFFSGTCCLFVLFLIQLKTAMIIGECYVKTNSKIHSIILITLCVLHGLLMLGDLSLQIWTILGQCCIIISIFLFLLTGIYLMVFHHGTKGVIVASFSLIAWIQPLILVAIQQ